MTAPLDPKLSSHATVNVVGQVLSLPPRWLAAYEEFVSKNAGQVSQMESALRSLTYLIPVAKGRFRDAEIASESIHSAVQLLSLYHDNLLARAFGVASSSMAAASGRSAPPPTSAAFLSSHARYTRYWSQRSPLYRRVALTLQMLVHTQLLWEMIAKRRAGNTARWRIVVAIEAAKAACRLTLLRITHGRSLLSPPLPEREAVRLREESDESGNSEDCGDADDSLFAHMGGSSVPHEREWVMPRTGMNFPSLPDPDDISSYLLGRVLTAENVKPATKLLSRLRGAGQAAEMLHILVPLVYAVAVARKSCAKSWTPWLVGIAIEFAARQLRERSLRTTALERDEWNRRAWAMAWWAMRGPGYHKVSKSVVEGVKSKMPGFVAGIVEDYQYIWENYYFSTST